MTATLHDVRKYGSNDSPQKDGFSHKHTRRAEQWADGKLGHGVIDTNAAQLVARVAVSVLAILVNAATNPTLKGLQEYI